MKALWIAILGSVVAGSAMAQIRITEWMYNGADGEFIEFTNVGNANVDMSGWSFDDSSRTAGSVNLSAFGIVAPGQSVILSEPTAATFRASWGGLSGVTIIGENSNNLGRNDEINIYDGSNNLIDRLTYNDQDSLVGGPQTSGKSGNIAFVNLGSNTASLAIASTVTDSFGSFTGTGGNIANPGKYTPVPEPATMAVLGLGIAGLARRKRK